MFLHPSDPVRDGLVNSLSPPGGNLTGVFGARDPVAKQLEYYQYIIPSLHRLLTLVDPTDATTPALLAQAQDAAQKLGLELDIQQASTDAQLGEIFAALAPGEVDGAFILSPSLRLNHSQRIIDLRQTPTCRSRRTARSGWPREPCSRSGSMSRLSVPLGRGSWTASCGAPARGPARRRSSACGVCVESQAGRRAPIDVPQDVITLADVIYR